MMRSESILNKIKGAFRRLLVESEFEADGARFWSRIKEKALVISVVRITLSSSEGRALGIRRQDANM